MSLSLFDDEPPQLRATATPTTTTPTTTPARGKGKRAGKREARRRKAPAETPAAARARGPPTKRARTHAPTSPHAHSDAARPAARPPAPADDFAAVLDRLQSGAAVDVTVLSRSEASSLRTEQAARERREGRGQHKKKKHELPDGYICHLCHEGGHWITQCPLGQARRLEQERLRLQAESAPPAPPADCRFHLQGLCRKGAECPFSHAKAPTRRPEVCKFLQRGACAKGADCRFSHDLSRLPCRFFLSNSCTQGDACPYSHSAPPPPAADDPAAEADVGGGEAHPASAGQPLRERPKPDAPPAWGDFVRGRGYERILAAVAANNNTHNRTRPGRPPGQPEGAPGCSEARGNNDS